jgi:hypothetical protein
VSVPARPAPPQGLAIKGRVLSWGVVPPAAGPARTQWCVDHGLKSLSDARREYGIAVREVMAHLPGGPRNLPHPYPLHEPHAKESALKIGRRRVKSWFELHNRLDSLDRNMRRKGALIFGTDCHMAEKAARASLQAAADAFNWLDDAYLDLGREILVDVGSFMDRQSPPQSVGALVELAHATVHASGELVGGLFGCKIVYDDGRWYDQCVVALLHLRFGNSAGLRVRYECTVCRQDPSDCEHEPGASYITSASRTEDGCSICGQPCCEHVSGRLYKVIARARLADPRLREVSLIPRPRDPLARITARSIEDEHLLKHLGCMPGQGEVVLDHSCMYPCTGFRTLPNVEQ